MAEVSFGEWLKRRRSAMGLTQEQLAQKIHCSVSALRKFEAELRHPSADVIEQLAEIFNIPQEEHKSFLRYARGDWQAISSNDQNEAPWQEKQIETTSPRNNLPLQLTSFIGREKEQAEIIDLLTKHRLVTLVGAGGIGKTRLSLEVAHEVLNTFPDGLWFIELAPLSDSALVPQAVVNTLGLIEQANRPPQIVLTDFLKAKKTLLILDNCEHLIQACAQLAETLLHYCPDLKILATSREALGISGEYTFHVATLSVPDIGQSLTIESLIEYEAVQLFLERAQTAMHDFMLSQDNVLAIAQICNHLDGIPLALELAAARLRGISTEQIAARLDNRFSLLTSGARTVLPRHQTLQALIDWSHDLLSEPERILLRRLSIFVGGWSLEAAEAVCAGDSLESNQILDLLLHLVDKSLVVAETHNAETRYHMLETVRQYAREKLRQAGEGDLLRQRHLAYFVDLAERAEPHLRAFGMIEWLDRLEIELDNIRVALDYLAESDIEAQLRITSALLWFWHIRGHKNEGVDQLERALSIEAIERGDQPLTPSRAMFRGKALYVAGFLRLMFFETDMGTSLSEKSLSIFQELGMAGKQGVAYALWNLSIAAAQHSDTYRQKALLEESFSLFQEIGDKFGMAQCLENLGDCAVQDSEYEQGRMLWEAGLALRQEIGDKDGAATAFNSLGGLASNQNNFKQATIHYETGLALFREVRNKWAMSFVLSNMGNVAKVQGDYRQATIMNEEALVFSQDVGDKFAIADRLSALGLVAISQGDYGRAIQMHEQALTLFNETGNQFLISVPLRNLGIAFLAQGDYKQASKHFDDALAISIKTDNKLETAFALYGKGRVAQSQGNFILAQNLNGEAIVIFRECDPVNAQKGVAYALESLAILAVAQSQMKRALYLFSVSENIYIPLRFELSANERAEHDQAIAIARAALGEEAFAAAWEEGKKMTLDEAIAYAQKED